MDDSQAGTARAGWDGPATAGGDGDGAGGRVAAALDGLAERLAGVEERLAEHHRRAAHREVVIDRLHEENQEHRAGARRQLLEPVVADLIRLHDGLTREAARLGGAGDGAVAALLASFATDVELSLGRCGLDTFTAEPGAAFVPGEHRPVGVVATGDPEGHNRVVEVLAAGFRDRETGRVRRPLQARFYRYQEGSERAAVPAVAPAAGEGPVPG